MPRPLLPPRGIHVPTMLVFHRDLSPTVIHTWIQLRALAWGQDETPQLSILQLSKLTDKSRSTIFGHLALLRQWGALRWRSSEDGTLIVSFPADTGEFHPDDEEVFLSPDESPQGGSRILDLPDPSPSSPDNHFDLNVVEEREGEDNQLDHSRGGPVQKPESPPRGDGQQSNNLDSDVPRSLREIQNIGLPPELDGAGPTKIYQSLTNIRPNQLQRKHLSAHIRDTNVWYASVEHWLSHGWNPKNIHGIIQLYQRGGPSACRYCPQDDEPQQDSLSILQKMRAELKESSRGSS